MTERARYRFVAKEYGDGTPWIILEPLNDTLSVLSKGFLGFDLPEGTSQKKAREIADFLDDNLTTMSFTQL